MNQSISSIWVAKRFSGTQAKLIIGHAHAGVGYYILERPDKGEAWCVAAFRVPASAISSEVSPIRDVRLIDKIERKMFPYLFVEDRKSGNTPPQPAFAGKKPAISPIADMFPNRKGSVPGWDALYGGKS